MQQRRNFLLSWHMRFTLVRSKKRSCLACFHSARFLCFSVLLTLSILSRFACTALHQVNGLIELLSDTRLSAQQEEYLGLLENSAMLLMTVINDVLDFNNVWTKIVLFTSYSLLSCCSELMLHIIAISCS
jgi:hypothetical protein